MTSPADNDGTTTDSQDTGEQVLGNTVDTTGAGGGTGGGGSNAPATTTETTGGGAGGSESPAAPPPAHEGFDTTQGGGSDRNAADNPAYNENAPTATPVNTVDTTKPGYDPNSADDPAYREPSGPVPQAGTTDTRNPGGSNVTVNPGSPDAATVGGGSVNPNAQEPGVTNSAYDAGGTRDTSGAGTNPNETFTAPGTIPAPINVHATAVAGRRAAHVTWDAGAGTPVGMVDGWTIEGSTGGTLRVPGNVRGAEIEEGLVGGQTYTFTVFGHNENGTGLRSTPSNPVTIEAGPIANDPTVRPEYDYASAPTAPQNVVATAGQNSATVTWAAPADDGGDAILDYTVTSDGGATQTVPAGTLTATFTGLAAGTPVTFTVTARNVNGTSPASAPSAAVTPTAPPATV